MAMSASEVKFEKALNLKTFVLLFILLVPLLFLASIQYLYTDKIDTVATFVIPMIYVIIIAEILARANSKLRLKPAQLALIFFAMSFVAAHSYLLMHTPGHRNMMSLFSWTLFMEANGLGMDAWFKDPWTQITPWFMFPAEPDRTTLAQVMVTGRVAGQAVNMMPLLIPILYWALILSLYTFINLFIVFGIVGRRWVETERLVFPMAVPTTFLFTEAGNVENNKSLLFNFKDPKYKIFWAAFIIGLLGALTTGPMISEVAPYLAWSSWWGETKVDLPFLADLWRGTYASSIFFWSQVAVFLLLPNDILITGILGWLVFGVLYQGIAVSMGWIPYEPGMEFRWPWEAVPGYWQPFAYSEWGALGLGVGIALWQLWTLRGRIKKVFVALTGADEVEYGLSLRQVAWFGVLSFVGYWALLVLSGGNFLVSLVYLVIVVLWAVLNARVWAEVFWHTNHFADAAKTFNLMYYTGSTLGMFPDPASVTWDNYNTNMGWQVVNKATFVTGNWEIMFSPLSSGWSINAYKIAHATKLDLKDALIALVSFTVIFAIIGQIIQAWMVINAGGLSRSNVFNWTMWNPTGTYFRGFWMHHPGGSINTDLIYLVSGVIITFLIYFLRAKYAMFPINPVALYITTFIPIYLWLDCLIALIIKTVAIRTVGVRKFESYVVPIAAGLVLGFGAPSLLALLWNFFTVALPKFQGQLVP